MSSSGQICTASLRFQIVHVLSLLSSVVLVIMGFRLASHSVPDAICVGSTPGGDADRMSINKAARMGGWTTLTAGAVAIVGVAFGSSGAYMKKLRCIQVAMILITIAIILGVIALLSGFFADHHGCGDYQCDGPLCSRSQVDEEARRLSGGISDPADAFVDQGAGSRCNPNITRCRVEYICKAEFDSFCEYDAKGGIGPFFITLVAIISMSLACCYECSTPPPSDDPADTEVAVGQPAAQTFGN